MEPKKRAEKEEEGRYTMLLGGATFYLDHKIEYRSKIGSLLFI